MDFKQVQALRHTLWGLKTQELCSFAGCCAPQAHWGQTPHHLDPLQLYLPEVVPQRSAAWPCPQDPRQKLIGWLKTIVSPLEINEAV